MGGRGLPGGVPAMAITKLLELDFVPINPKHRLLSTVVFWIPHSQQQKYIAPT